VVGRRWEAQMGAREPVITKTDTERWPEGNLTLLGQK
jgi:hypothetical protein